MNDLELLRQYAQQGSQAAFAALVGRYVDFVHSVARRHLRSDALAEEITQAVFLDLARNAGSLRSDSHLASWLHTVARRTSIDVVRREIRRHEHEQTALEGAALMNEPEFNWGRVEPLLDEAIAALSEEDRRAVLLRFFEKKSLRDVGDAIGASEEAARKRVDRGVDRLRGFFERRGVTASTAVLTADIAANAVHAAPVALVQNVAGIVAFSGSTALPAALIHSTQTIAMTAFQKTAAVVALTAALSGGLYQRQVIQIQERQIAALTDESAKSQRQLSRLNAEKTAAGEQRRSASLDGIRASATPVANPATIAMEAWVGRVQMLRDRIKQSPALDVPELKFLTDEDWLAAAKNELATEEDYRKATSSLRTEAGGKVTAKLFPALGKYLTASGGQFPTGLSDLQAYLETPLDEAILQRFTIIPAKDVPNVGVGGDRVISIKAPIDEKYDQRLVIGAKGYGRTSYNTPPNMAMLNEIEKAYRAAHNGARPQAASDLEPYATTPEQQSAVQKVIEWQNSQKASAK